MLSNVTTFELLKSTQTNEDSFSSVSDNPGECSGKSHTLTTRIDSDDKLTSNIVLGALYDHFRRIAAVRYGNGGRIEVWVENPEAGTQLARAFDRFSLIPECRSISNGRELIVSFNGTSSVFRFPVSSIDLRGTDCDLMIDGEILRYGELTREQKQRFPSAYPVLDENLAAQLGVPTQTEELPATYSLVLEKVRSFHEKFLRDQTIGTLIKISAEGLLAVPEERVLHLDEDSDALLFANGKTGVNPESELFGSGRTSGPFLASPHREVRFFFVFRPTDARVCRQLEYVLGFGSERQAGPKAFPSLGESIRQPFNTAKELNIEFDLDLNRRPRIEENAEKALHQIEEELLERNFKPDVRYVAIFINPVESTNPEHPVNRLYCKLAELLLVRNIIPQNVSRAEIVGGNFGGPLADLSTRILAKIDGVPWALPERETKGGIIFGIGRLTLKGKTDKTLTTVCRFSESGHFHGGNCIQGNGGEDIAAHVRNSMMLKDVKNIPASRVILHFDGQLSEAERTAIPDALRALDSGIDFFSVEISRHETHGRAVFDLANRTLLPKSGTFIRLNPENFLLFSNSDSGQEDGGRTQFPIRIRISKHGSDQNGEKSELSDSEARDIIGRVHGLCLICWHSVRRQNLPVTVMYPELIASAVRHFKNKALPPFGERTMWFL